ncbi:acyl-CoA dehydrogenase family protein [Cellulophaga baltica]|uniref:acyl-CoA dehydrogenase family protein n=1 Tax=Cellulophaga TaxID=104264 RepID=UPI001C06AAE1|nr:MULTISPECIES: acyl-CoA dehydrogenase [Cellulophaga]MBU2997197.1 acyl-CoA dehydrogenase family protein [Cellulophaga baltica]MDO6768595.1 acyl-CoA dehydrogenase [Cellulophaga sp. 1_MG-2023]
MKKINYTSGIIAYIPFFYVIWSDDLLTASEINVVKTAIANDSSLSKEEKNILNSWLNTKDSPSDKTIKSWKQAILNSNLKLVESSNYPLSIFSQELLKHYGNELPINEQLKHIELNLGIQPNHYNHLFNVEINFDSTLNYYNPKEINKLVKGEYFSIVEDFHKVLKDPIFNCKVERKKEDFRTTVLEQVKFLASKKYGAMAYPNEYGGIDDMPAYAFIFENMMYVGGSLSIKFGVQFGLFGGSIQKLGTKKHHDQYLTETGDAKLLGCFAMTETGHGSNVRGIKTTATYEQETDSLVIHTPGRNDNKEYIGNALDSKMASVFAQLIVNGKNEGVHAILVPIRDEKHKLLQGVKIEDNGYKLGLNGVDNGKIWFNQVRVPRGNLLNKYGSIKDDGTYFSEIENPNKRFFTMLGTLVGGRICVARAGLGGAKKALTIAVKHALKRRQFNDSIKIQEDLLMDYPTHQLRLTPAIAKSYVYDVTLQQIMKEYSDVNKPDKRKIETQVAGLKSIITWFANETIQECREACGGKGYLIENQIADLKGDVDIFTTFEGDNTVLLQLAAKGVLSDFKSEFNSAGFTSVLKLLSTQINDKLTTINPLYINNVDIAHLYDSKFHKNAFEYRTRRLTYTAAMRIKNYIKKGVPSYQAFLKVQTHLLALGKAYSCELAYNTFIDFTDKINDDKNKALFVKLANLYALQEIRTNATWYLEQGYIGTTKSKAIRQRIERLCTELRPHIGNLVDGFGIPDDLLNAPIAIK